MDLKIQSGKPFGKIFENNEIRRHHGTEGTVIFIKK